MGTQRRYAVVPLEWVQLAPELLAALVVLDAYQLDREKSWPSLDTLAEHMNCSRSTAKRRLDTLHEMGLLVRETTAGGRSKTNSYRIENPVRHAPVVDKNQSTSDTVTAVNPSTGDTGQVKPLELENSSSPPPSYQPPILTLVKTVDDPFAQKLVDSLNRALKLPEPIQLNAGTQAICWELRCKGFTVDQVTTQIQQWWQGILATGKKVRNPGGYVCTVGLPGVSSGTLRTTPTERATPVPPSYSAVIERQECCHGAEVGFCALCRISERAAQYAASQ